MSKGLCHPTSPGFAVRSPSVVQEGCSHSLLWLPPLSSRMSCPPSGTAGPHVLVPAKSVAFASYGKMGTRNIVEQCTINFWAPLLLTPGLAQLFLQICLQFERQIYRFLHHV
jgi:hypothetical protein